MKMFYDVIISRKRNGILVKVGCKEFVFCLKEMEVFLKILELYITDPLKAIDVADKSYELNGDFFDAGQTGPTEPIGVPISLGVAAQVPVLNYELPSGQIRQAI